MPAASSDSEKPGSTLEVTEKGHPYTDMVNNTVMADLFAANSAALGRPMGRMEDFDPSEGGSSDMGNVSHIVPSIHPMLGINSAPWVNHQKEFAAHTVTPDGDAAIRDGAIAMAHTIIDVATQNRWDELGSPGG